VVLAIFDLDNTLIAGDSDHAWGDFLITKGVVDPLAYKKTNDQFYQDYVDGILDIHKYLRFALEPLTREPLEKLTAWRDEFMHKIISPMLLSKGKDLLAWHRQAGHHCLIVTATNSFVTDPIARELGVDDLIATEPEIIDGRYTGEIAGTPSYQEGKVIRINDWLRNKPFRLADAWFYSDSHNDIPLLQRVGHPVAVDADDKLSEHATRHHWQQISLR
jgi:HAD superfamily hydrolase (TIGR01490 family)